jgi:pimeloyl-ACP methyl ester carboxylesterase
MKEQIEKLSRQETWVIPIPQLLWLALLFPYGWIPILKRLDSVLDRVHASSAHVKVTLIGHSIGGVLGLLYLVYPPSRVCQWKRRDVIDHLITLGSPHRNRCRWLHGGNISRLVEKFGALTRIPHDVRLTCIAGKSVLGDKNGALAEKRAYRIYKAIGKEGRTWGDGIVPVSSAHPESANLVPLEDVAHFSRMNHLWYGSPKIVTRWWDKIRSV